MLFTPSVFGENLMDRWFDDFFEPWTSAPAKTEKKLYGKNADRLMKTDVTEHEDHFEIDVDLPGFKKEDLKLSLEKGYLTISAAKALQTDETEKKSGRVIRRERYSGNMMRSFYVGEQVKEEDVKARFEDGVLRLCIPKVDAKKAVEEKKAIAIEG